MLEFQNRQTISGPLMSRGGPKHESLTQEINTALRWYRRTKSLYDKVEPIRTTAFARCINRTARREYWNSFVASITKDTPMSIIWKRVRKINGKYAPTPSPSLLVNGVFHQEPEVVSNFMAEHVAATSMWHLLFRCFLTS